MKKLFLLLALSSFGLGSLHAGWTSAPPGSATEGNTITVGASGNAFGGFSATMLVLWWQNPSGTWSSTVLGANANGGGISGSTNITLSTAGTWTFEARLISPASTPAQGSSPYGTANAGANSTTVNPNITPTTFSFGNLSHTYDGNTKTASVTPNPGNATYTSDLTKGPGAGSYTVSASAYGNFSNSGATTATLNIAKANQATLTLGAATTQAYAAGQTLSASGGTGGGGVTYVITNWSATNNVTLSGATLTANAGSGWADIRADKAADANYNATSSAVVRVNLTTATASFSFGNLSHTYDGNTKTATVTPTPGGATYTSDLTKGPGVGSYTVTATANGNYSGSGSNTLTISKANQGTLTLSAATSQAYAAAQTLSASGGAGGGGVTYVITNWSAANNVTLSGATLTANAGSGWADIRADKAADANYNATSSAVVRVNLTTAAASFSFGNLSHTYDGNTKTATVTPTPGGATHTSDLTKGPGAGSYTVTATANGNYSGSGSSTLTIAKANQSTLTLSAATSQQYGLTQTLSASGGSGGGAVSYMIAGQSAGGNASLSGAVLTANASSGWVDVQATKAADANYHAANSSAVRVNLAIRTTTFALSQPSFTYNGSVQGPTINPTPGGATFTSGGTLSATNVGSYTATATATGNYSGSNSSLGWNIAAGSQTITFNNPGTRTYGTPLTLGATASSGLPVSYAVTAGSATVSGNIVTFTGTGSVTLTATQGGDANYGAAPTVAQSFSVNQATPTGTFASRTLGSQTLSTYTVQAGDLNALFAGPGGAAAPTGTITYSIVGPGTAVTAGIVLAPAAYTIRASYPGDANYNATTKDATWTVTNDSDGDGVPDYVEALLGTNPGVARQTDSANQAEQKIHQPN